MTSYPLIGSIPVVGFWIMVLWSLYDGDLYPKEGISCIVIWLILLGGTMLLSWQPVVLLVGSVFLDIYLMAKIFGQSSHMS